MLWQLLVIVIIYTTSSQCSITVSNCPTHAQHQLSVDLDKSVKIKCIHTYSTLLRQQHVVGCAGCTQCMLHKYTSGQQVRLDSQFAWMYNFK